MTARRRKVFIAVCVLTLGGACWERCADRNHDRAYYARDGAIYRVQMSGVRFPLVHDPLSLVLGRTRRTIFTLELPRIEGVIDGSEFVRSGSYRYSGRVEIRGGRMKVDLRYPDEGEQRPLSWNGEYTLAAGTLEPD